MPTNTTTVAATITGRAVVAASIADSAIISASVGTQVYRDPDPYEGDYVSSPKSFQQVYETTDKTMLDDFTVLEIPIYSADNDANGVTVTIGEG